MPFYLLVCLWSGALQAEQSTPPVLQVSYPHVYSDPVYRDISDYIHNLLDLILSKSGVPYEITDVTVPPVPTSRTIMYLNAGRFNVAWGHTNAQIEQQLTPIRIPIFRGLGGWRLMFVRTEDTRTSSITKLAQLKKLVVGQGHDWPDTDILAANGFSVRTAIARDNLFQLLKHDRIDAFPRGVTEIWDESLLPQAAGLRIEEHLVLRYPTAFYLFLKKDETKLAGVLTDGFEQAVADGSFRQLFLDWKGDIFERAQLDKRLIIEIGNPLLSPETPLQRNELWFHMSDLKYLKR